jgi:hypothetical protein
MFWVETVMSKVERSSLSPHLYLCLNWNSEDSMISSVEKFNPSSYLYCQQS